MLLLATGFAFAATSFLVYALMRRAPAITERRLGLAALANDRIKPTATADDEIVASRLTLVASRLRQFLPSTLIERFGLLLQTANVRTPPEILLVGWIGLALAAPAGFLLLVARGGTGLTSMDKLVALMLLVLFGYAPLALLRGRVRKRRALLLKELPDMMDLLTTCVEAGLGIDAAFAKVAEKSREPMAEEVRVILRTMAMGRPRREALEQFANRTGLPEIISFTGAVIQAERMGVSLGQVLRVQSDALRVQRKQRAEQKAFKAPIKIIMVLAVFIFPSMFIVILGPAALSLMNSGL
ncbi:MAG TPA: type II secretion system F family protein [Dehalococcoidia bacterium]|jgi:tight adherence protein C|nr:type II secretion system F family protein [Dehalococcoidia bacterium]